MDKYYTPELSEFFVGFQYEEKGDLQGWYKTEFGDSNGEYNNELSEVSWGINHDKIRVKYLSQEDIESLGFEFKTDLYIKNGLTLQVHKDSITIKYYDNFNNEWRTKVEQIVIKNKSELIKLLKQLDIG